MHNCLDRHLTGPNKNKLALIWQSEDGKERRTFSYFSLNRRVNEMANILKAMGVAKGDRVTIYLPRIPEVFFAMLACAKIGAVHSVIFAGFSADALTDRIDDSQSKLVITADGSWVNGSVFPLKEIVDAAVKFSPTVENVIVIKRTVSEVTMDRCATTGTTTCSCCRSPRASARPRSWTPSIRCTSCTRRVRPGSRRRSCTPTAATWSAPTPR